MKLQEIHNIIRSLNEYDGDRRKYIALMNDFIHTHLRYTCNSEFTEFTHSQIIRILFDIRCKLIHNNLYEIDDLIADIWFFIHAINKN